MIQGAIFDFDGTLFDSMGIWDTAGKDYLQSVNRVAAEDLQDTLKTMSLYQSACYLQKAYQISQSVEAIMAGINRVVEDFYFHTAQPKPGVGDLLELLRRQDVKLCIATATDRYQVEAALRRCGLSQFFQAILTCTEVGHGKEQPQIFRAALALLQTHRTNTIVVEDALHAIQTAKADGFITVAVYDSHETNQQKVQSLADFYLPDYSDLRAFQKFALCF